MYNKKRLNTKHKQLFAKFLYHSILGFDSTIRYCDEFCELFLICIKSTLLTTLAIVHLISLLIFNYETKNIAFKTLIIIIFDSKSFLVKVSLHQGWELIRFIFTVIMKDIFKSIWETVPCYMLFANDVVLVTETKEEVNNKLEERRAFYIEGCA